MMNLKGKTVAIIKTLKPQKRFGNIMKFLLSHATTTALHTLTFINKASDLCQA